MSHHRYAVAANVKPVGRRVARIALCLCLLAFLATPSFSNEQCQYPNVFGPALAPPENRVGEFRIAVQPPDYNDITSVQRHLIYSTVWTRLLRSELASETHGRCTFIAERSLFPDLRVLLIENRTQGTQAAASSCIDALRGLLVTSRSGKDEINKASSSEAASWLRRVSNAAGEATGAGNILRAAFEQIYDANTVMHSLASIKPEAFQSLDAELFLAWLRHQQLSGSLGLNRLRLCNPEDAANADAKILPFSSTIPPGKLTLTIGSNEPTLSRRVRHVLIVGEGPALNYSRSNKPAIEKYCNRELALETDQKAVAVVVAAVRIRCLRTVQYDAAWTVFYCDPADCKYEHQAEVAMAKLAIDPDVIELAKDNVENRSDKGPYLVDIKVKVE